VGQKWRKYFERLKWYDFLAISLIVLGVMVVVVSLVRDVSGGEAEVVYLASEDSGGRGSVWVDVSGAVVRPGVYELDAQARLKDVLALCGGLSAEADREFVEKRMNMAEKVKDGQKIIIPRVTPQGMGSGEAKTVGEYSNGVSVNINSASLSELDSLWGVGEARAKAIIDGRPYADVSELLSRGIVPKNVFERIKDGISVY
jgi:competence protein ComEA